MGWGNNIPPPPKHGHPCPANNPHCQGLDPIGASIESDILITILIIAGIFLVLNALKIINMKTLFKKVSTFLWGEKSFRWGELKGL